MLEARLKQYLVIGSGPVTEAPGVQELLRSVRGRLVQDRTSSDLQRDSFRRELETEAWRLLGEECRGSFSHLMLSAAERTELFKRLMQSMFGFGPLEPLLQAPDVTEVMVNGPHRIFTECGNRLELARDSRGRPVRFVDEQELRYVIDKILAPINKKVDESDPIVDARLPDGSRVSVVLHPLALSGTTLTIRRFPERPYTMAKLCEFGTIARPVADLLSDLVRARFNLIVSGGTGTGKTTLLNALSMEIPGDQRLVTVEDAAELRLAAAENLVRLESRPANLEGKGEITIRQLVRSALRMRPDRIIVGEVRGGEALDMLQAMNTGHDGSLTTVHANSAQDVISRLETMVLMSGLELPVSAIRNQIVGAVDLIFHMSRTASGARRVVQVSQVVGDSSAAVQVEDLLVLDHDASGQEPELRPTGALLRRWQKIFRAGVSPRELLTRLIPVKQEVK